MITRLLEAVISGMNRTMGVHCILRRHLSNYENNPERGKMIADLGVYRIKGEE